MVAAHTEVLRLVPGRQFPDQSLSELVVDPARPIVPYAADASLLGQAVGKVVIEDGLNLALGHKAEEYARVFQLLSLEPVHMIESGITNIAEIDRVMEQGYGRAMGLHRINYMFEPNIRLATGKTAHQELRWAGSELQRILRHIVTAPVTLSTSLTPQVLFETTSPFGRIVVEQQGAKRALRLGEQRVVQTVTTLGKPSEIDSEYIQLAMATFLFVPEVKRVLVIGLGGGAMPMFLRWVDPALVIDVVEINPEVVRIAKEWFHFREDTRLRAHIADGLAFVEEPGPRYDVILLDAYAPDFVPPHLTTMRFLTALTNRLSASGVVVSNVWGPPSLQYETIVAAQRAAFPELYILRCVREDNQLLIGFAQSVGR
jgi:spermidine synthase